MLLKNYAVFSFVALQRAQTKSNDILLRAATEDTGASRLHDVVSATHWGGSRTEPLVVQDGGRTQEEQTPAPTRLSRRSTDQPTRRPIQRRDPTSTAGRSTLSLCTDSP